MHKPVAPAPTAVLLYADYIPDSMQLAGAKAVRFDTPILNKMFTANAVFRAMAAAAPGIVSPDTVLSELSWYEFEEADFEKSEVEGGYLALSRDGGRRLTEYFFRALGIKEANFEEDEFPTAYMVAVDRAVVSGSEEARMLTQDQLNEPLYRRPGLWCDIVARRLKFAHERALAEKDSEIEALKAQLADANSKLGVATISVDPNCIKANEAFEQWAIGKKMDMTQHSIHWLFLNPQTNAARQGWKGALEYAQRVSEKSCVE
jgi:hypothetical protein